jgi:hypothetical protein
MSIGVLVTLGLATGAVAAGAPLFSRQAVAQKQRHQAGDSLPDEKTIGKLEQVAAFTGSMPTGVTVAQGGRIFVNYPRWGDPVPFTVAEIKDGQPVAYLNTDINKLDTEHAADTLVSVQSVVVDPRTRLWILDTGSVNSRPPCDKGCIKAERAREQLSHHNSFKIELAQCVIIRTSQQVVVAVIEH